MLFIIDIDGSISDWKIRDRGAGPAPDRADKEAYANYINRLMDPANVMKDIPILGMQLLLRGMATREEVKLVYLTGRSEKLRFVTERWLTLNRFPEAKLLMRNNNDWRSAVEYKEEALLNLKGQHQEVMAIEDEPNVVKMMVSHGVVVLQVNYKDL